MSHNESRRSNRLASETSPYLLQHQHNPVDWYAWGDEAIARSRAEDKPIFLSVGYSACHWCHVMERESFENEDIAAIMNRHFINVKVDREERPDVDAIYMNAVQAMTGHGGWPMSVFLTPDLQPFYGGTYYPPRDARGMPGFPRVLESVARAWADRRSEIIESAGQMTEQLRSIGSIPSSDGDLDFSLLDRAYQRLARSFDPRNGGFGDAPKFPHPMDLKVLLRHYVRTGDEHALHMVKVTLDKMARGGIYDHLGGGFARYSTDDRWLVPHFEKMLYDNALLASVYHEAFQVTNDPEFNSVVNETLSYILRRMTGPEGGFYSTEDADSEGVEGKYYVWTLEEIRSVLGADRCESFAAYFGVREGGNWEGHSILNRSAGTHGAVPVAEEQLALLEDSAKLLKVRDQRIAPAKDTKVLTSWNGLMIAAMADASRGDGITTFLEGARNAASFFLDRMRQPDGRLWHCYKDGNAKINGFLDDYACLIDGLTRLFEATGEGRWILGAIELAELMIAEFSDPESGGFFFTGKHHEALIARQKDVYDNATPSGNGMAATALLRLASLTGRDDFESTGRATLQAARTVLEKMPTAAGQSLIALDFLLSQRQEIAIFAGQDKHEFQEALKLVGVKFQPHGVVAPRPSGMREPLLDLFKDRQAIDGRMTTYICTYHTCEAPIVGIEPLREALT